MSIPKIPKIDIQARLKNEAEIMKLLALKADYMEAEISGCQEPNFEYWGKRILIYQLRMSVKQNKILPAYKKGDPDLMEILIAKKAWLETLLPKIWYDRIQVAKELYFTKLYIDQGFYACMIPRESQEWVEVLKFELETLLSVANNEDNNYLMSKLERDNRIFYVKEEIMARAANDSIVRLEKDVADSMINNKIYAYTEIISLLKKKRAILKGNLSPNPSNLDEIEKMLDLFKLDTEIASKEDFLKRYIERKNVLP
jgi:hypothetical protein